MNSFIARFWNIHRSGVLTALARLVPHETAAVSAQVLCRPCNHAPCRLSCRAPCPAFMIFFFFFRFLLFCFVLLLLLLIVLLSCRAPCPTFMILLVLYFPASTAHDGIKQTETVQTPDHGQDKINAYIHIYTHEHTAPRSWKCLIPRPSQIPFRPSCCAEANQ